MGRAQGRAGRGAGWNRDSYSLSGCRVCDGRSLSRDLPEVPAELCVQWARTWGVLPVFPAFGAPRVGGPDGDCARPAAAGEPRCRVGAERQASGLLGRCCLEQLTGHGTYV